MMETTPKQRTPRQNASLHLLLTHIADELNDSGLYMQQVLKHDAEIPWSPEMVKQLLYRPFIRAMYQKESTKDLDTKQIGDSMNTMCDHLAKTTGKAFEIPSIESLMLQQQLKK